MLIFDDKMRLFLFKKNFMKGICHLLSKRIFPSGFLILCKNFKMTICNPLLKISKSVKKIEKYLEKTSLC